MRRPAAGHWIEVRVGDRVYALEASSILRVIPGGELVSLPATRPEVAGVLLLDRAAVPVYRLARLLDPAGAGTGAEGGAPEAPGDVVVVDDRGVRAGFLVDGAERASAPPGPGARTLDGRRLLAAAGMSAGRASDGTAARAADGEL